MAAMVRRNACRARAGSLAGMTTQLEDARPQGRDLSPWRQADARTRHRRRRMLLAVVVAKLFLVDSARTGGLGRAVAFIGVALLILLIGYVAPLPPRERQREEAAS